VPNITVRQEHFSVPSTLNTLLVSFVLGTSLFLLWLASQLPVIWSIPIGIIFSFILLTNYALMHEAAHKVLHNNHTTNKWLGALASWLFPMSFTMFAITHTVHHRCNRTDFEMFDYYYPTDNTLLKYLQWYSILVGIYWPIIPVGSLLMAFVPWIYRTKPFKKARTTAVLFDNFDEKALKTIRIEVITGILFWVAIWQVFSLAWPQTLILYLFFSFNWSTRQYVTHAFSPRHVINGAHNLSVSRLMGWILLNGQWDLVHHQHPDCSWKHLPEYAPLTRPPIKFWPQYFKLWRGPRPNTEPAPEALNAVPS